jgi:hypothetical protein
MLPQARHEFHEIARLVPRIQLPAQDFVPTVAASTGGAGEREKVGAAREAAGGAAKEVGVDSKDLSYQLHR